MHQINGIAWYTLVKYIFFLIIIFYLLKEGWDNNRGQGHIANSAAKKCCVSSWLEKNKLQKKKRLDKYFGISR